MKIFFTDEFSAKIQDLPALWVWEEGFYMYFYGIENPTTWKLLSLNNIFN